MIRKIVAWILGFVAVVCVLDGMLILGSNAVARLHPDGFPIDPTLHTFVWAVLLGIAAAITWPPSPRRNRRKDDYRSKLPVPLERVL
jgi:hypothetical protein